MTHYEIAKNIVTVILFIYVEISIYRRIRQLAGEDRKDHRQQTQNQQ